MVAETKRPFSDTIRNEVETWSLATSEAVAASAERLTLPASRTRAPYLPPFQPAGIMPGRYGTGTPEQTSCRGPAMVAVAASGNLETASDRKRIYIRMRGDLP